MCKNDIKLSIVIPTYKRLESFKTTIQSIFEQEETILSTYVSILVIDNDPDGTDIEKYLDSLKKIEKKIEISYFKNNRNLGQIGNWNKGILLAQTEWVMLLHDDDYLLPHCLEYIFSCIEKNPDLDGIFTTPLNIRSYESMSFFKHKVKSIRNSYKKRFRNHLSQLFPADYYFDCGYNAPIAAIYKKSVFINLGGFSEDKFPISDLDFHYRFSQKYNLQVLSVFGCIQTTELSYSNNVDIQEMFLYQSYLMRLQMMNDLKPTLCTKWWVETSVWVHKECFFPKVNRDSVKIYANIKYDSFIYKFLYKTIVFIKGFQKKYYLQTEKLY